MTHWGLRVKSYLPVHVMQLVAGGVESLDWITTLLVEKVGCNSVLAYGKSGHVSSFKNLVLTTLASSSQCKFLGEHLSSQMSLVHHITEKWHIVERLMQNCVIVSTKSILSKIKMQVLLNLYKSCKIPALIYGFETWISTTEDKPKISKIQLSAIRRILKIPTSTPLVSIYIETGELPIMLECEKRQLTSLWVLLDSENQIKDILDI